MKALRPQYMHVEHAALGAAALAWVVLYSPLATAEQTESFSDMPPTETAQLGAPLPENTLESSSYEPPAAANDNDIFSDAYHFAKSSGTMLVSDIKNIRLSSSDAQQARPAAMQQAPQKSVWDSVSDSVRSASDSVAQGATDAYRGTIHMFDKNHFD